MASRVFSVEDGNQTTQSVVTARKQLYKDIDLSFAKAPNGDVYKKIDLCFCQTIRKKSYYLTNNYEKPFAPNFGANIRSLLFDLADEDLADRAKTKIMKAIDMYEPRVIVNSIKVDVHPDNHDVRIHVNLKIKNSSSEFDISTSLNRLR
jgi:phage baseplate assembly protein W